LREADIEFKGRFGEEWLGPVLKTAEENVEDEVVWGRSQFGVEGATFVHFVCVYSGD